MWEIGAKSLRPIFKELDSDYENGSAPVVLFRALGKYEGTNSQ